MDDSLVLRAAQGNRRRRRERPVTASRTDIGIFPWKPGERVDGPPRRKHFVSESLNDREG